MASPMLTWNRPVTRSGARPARWSPPRPGSPGRFPGEGSSVELTLAEESRTRSPGLISALADGRATAKLSCTSVIRAVPSVSSARPRICAGPRMLDLSARRGTARVPSPAGRRPCGRRRASGRRALDLEHLTLDPREKSMICSTRAVIGAAGPAGDPVRAAPAGRGSGDGGTSASSDPRRPRGGHGRGGQNTREVSQRTFHVTGPLYCPASGTASASGRREGGRKTGGAWDFPHAPPGAPSPSIR